MFGTHCLWHRAVYQSIPTTIACALQIYFLKSANVRCSYWNSVFIVLLSYVQGYMTSLFMNLMTLVQQQKPFGCLKITCCPRDISVAPNL